MQRVSRLNCLTHIIGNAGQSPHPYYAAGISRLSRSFCTLVSRTDLLRMPEGAIYARVPVDQDIVSLSAILLDDAYFDALQAAKRQVDGVTIVDETLLIPFKARAVLDLTARSEEGANIDRKDIRKHRNDVFRLAQLLPKDTRVALPESVRQDLGAFVDQAHADRTLDPRAFDVPFTRDEAADLLRTVYGLT